MNKKRAVLYMATEFYLLKIANDDCRVQAVGSYRGTSSSGLPGITSAGDVELQLE